MTLQFEKLIEETFSDLQNISVEKFQGLIQETMKVFTALQEKMKSEDPKEREEAMQAALSLRETLQQQAESICKKLGMNPEQLTSFAETPANFSDDEWKDLSEAKQDLDAFKKQFVPKTPPKKSKKGPKTWLVG